jgi:hypothetical protein
MDQINRKLGCFTYDPSISGYDTSFWKALSGSPSVVSNKLRLSSAEISSYVAFRELDVEFTITIPTAPTSGDARAFGLKIPALGNRARVEFDITGAVFSCKVYDDTATAQLSQAITWDASWTNTAIKYRIQATASGVKFYVNGACVARAEMQGLTANNSLPTIGGYLHISNGNADNMDITAVVVKDAQLVDTTLRPVPSSSSGSSSSSSSGSSSAGGGNNTYSTEQGDFSATVTDSTYNIVLSTDTIGGQTITEANFANGILKVMDVSASPKEFKTITLDKFTWNSSTKTLDVTNCTGAFLFGTGDIVSLTLTGADKIRDAATDSQKTSLIRDVSDQYGNETLIDTTNVAAGTNYYPSSSGLQMDNYSSITIQGKTSGGVTTTIEATNDDAASPDWFDITKSFTDLVTNTSSNASYVDVNFLLAPTGRDVLSVKAIRIKSVTSTSTNVVKYNIRRIY